MDSNVEMKPNVEMDSKVGMDSKDLFKRLSIVFPFVDHDYLLHVSTSIKNGKTC